MYSVEHIYYNRTEPEFWNWSFEDMANKDIPATLKYIYQVTKNKIYYVGR